MQWMRWMKVYCATLYAMTRERYKQKNQTYVGRDPYVMKRSDFSTELKDFPAIEAVDISNTSFYRHTLTLQSSEMLHVTQT